MQFVEFAQIRQRKNPKLYIGRINRGPDVQVYNYIILFY